MNGWMLSPILADTAGRYLLWPAFWAALALLAAASVWLLRSRWARSHPLNRYILLSVLAHLVLLGCAATVHIVLAPPTPREVVQVTIVDAHEDATAHAEPRTPLDPKPPTHEDPALDAAALAHNANEYTPPELPPWLAEVGAPPSATAPATEPELSQQPETSQASTWSNTEVDPAAQLKDQAPTQNNAPEHTVDASAIQPTVQGSDLPNDEPPPPDDEPDWIAPQQKRADGGFTATTENAPQPLAASAPRQPQGLQQAPSNEPTAAEAADRTSPVPPLYSWRRLGSRRQHALASGGSDETEGAVEAALHWLAQTQSPSGVWEARRFGAGQERWIDGHNRQGAGANADTGVTGLALLAFLGAGYTHLHGDYRDTVAAALDYLLRIQAPSGHLAANADPYAFMYCHGMACLALSEAYAMTGDKTLETAVERAIAYTLSAQHPQTGGWRYRPGELGDTSQLGWQLMALMSAEHAGVTVPAHSYVLASRFLDSVGSGPHGGLASYRPRERPTRTMTAEALVCRYLLAARASPGLGSAHRPDPRFALASSTEREATDFLLQEPPGTGQDNVYYWYYGSMAMYQAGGESWERWNRAMTATLLSRQRRTGHLAGSWDPDRVWGSHGGRVYATAMSALCLEVYYRYLPLYRLAQNKRQHRR